MSPREWSADSPEQARAWLRFHLYFPSVLAWRKSTSQGATLHLPRRVFFRGQADASWRPQPTLLRLADDVARRAEQATRLAVAIINVEFSKLWSADGTQNWPPFCERAAMAAAQHYGMPTDLLDWTSNPSVAVHFASSGQSSQIAPRACVMWLDARAAADLGLRPVLPPIYVERLYLQRGLFTEVDAERVLAIEGAVSRITFPPLPRCPAADTAGAEIDLLPRDPWFQALKTWSVGRMDAAELLANPVGATMAFTMRHGHHTALQRFSAFAIFDAPDHLGVISAYINELAGRWLGDKRVYDPDMLDLIERDNPAFFAWCRTNIGEFPRWDT